MGDPPVKTTLLRPFSCPSDENRCRRHSRGLFSGSKFCHDRYAVTDAWGLKRAFRIGFGWFNRSVWMVQSPDTHSKIVSSRRPWRSYIPVFQIRMEKMKEVKRPPL
ncbi:hypothetical protein B296_00044833 [Ensete ventricosum]|uniref:Uncharacterized protein n=1 Tax=Ensete ventricosum TaxID=4639 RepID=A0A426XNM8_ENSVE|nr:hypothetical protein B296_00044833 [Ensete ventricosum]